MSKKAFPELIDILSSFDVTGFTRLQAAAYIAILKMGEETGSAIAAESGINRSKIYDILGQLEEMNAVKKISRESKPKYTAVDPNIVLSKILAEFTGEIDKSKQLLESLADLREDINEVNITLTTLFLKDLDVNEFEYLIASRERSRTQFLELLPKDYRPGYHVKVLDLNDETKERGNIILINQSQLLIFGTPVGQSVEALKIEENELSRFFTGIIENHWNKDLPEEIQVGLRNKTLNVLLVGKALTMNYQIAGVEQQKFERPVTFFVTDDSISFSYYGNIDPSRIMIRFINKVVLEGDNTILIQTGFHDGRVGELRMKTVEDPIYLHNLLISFSAKEKEIAELRLQLKQR
ncbi:MAG: TrmB family transcriptional regulator [Candidatus Kariarchaeaceae archaeon]